MPGSASDAAGALDAAYRGITNVVEPLDAAGFFQPTGHLALKPEPPEVAAVPQGLLDESGRVRARRRTIPRVRRTGQKKNGTARGRGSTGEQEGYAPAGLPAPEGPDADQDQQPAERGRPDLHKRPADDTSSWILSSAQTRTTSAPTGGAIDRCRCDGPAVERSDAAWPADRHVGGSRPPIRSRVVAQHGLQLLDLAGRVQIGGHYLDELHTDCLVHVAGQGDTRSWSAAPIPAGPLAHLRLSGPHSLRHTFATWLEDAGNPARVIDELIGHANGRTAAHGSRIGGAYRETTDEMRASVVAALEECLTYVLKVAKEKITARNR